MDTNESRIDSKEIENAVEAILFAAGYPVSYSKLGEVLGIGEGTIKKNPLTSSDIKALLGKFLIVTVTTPRTCICMHSILKPC